VTSLPSPNAVAAPGWYHDGTAQRWWDGASWGPYAPVGPPPAGSNGKTWAILAHCPIGTILLPILAYALEGDKDPFVKHHAVEALNYQITTFIVSAIGGVIFMTTVFSRMFRFNETSGPPAGFIAMWIGIMAINVLHWVFGIRGMLAANKHKLYRYPFSIRIIKGAIPKAA
jgi:uncharacterized Tic20 family protein